MKFLLLSVLVLVTGFVLSQQTYGDSLSLQLETVVTTSGIEVNWLNDPQANSIKVYRKSVNAQSWGNFIADLSGTATSYLDATIVENTIYDYKVEMTSSSQLTRIGYISSGRNVRAKGAQGIAIVVIDSLFLSNSNLSNGLDTYIMDLELDGWYPEKIFVNNTTSVAVVKQRILSISAQYPNTDKTVMLLGNVPVPYSGEMNPDGHGDHIGAWPCDGFYGDIDGNWTDNSINNTSSANPLNHNVPGDGKFDNDIFASSLEMAVGRMDFSGLPSSGSVENLTIQYLTKLHDYKAHNWQVQRRALIDDNFTGYSEGFSQGGYRNFSSLVGRSNIENGDFHDAMDLNTSANQGYLWAYGCGAGWYTSASGVGNSSSFATDSLNVVFTMLFGSYFGDWNYNDGFLKSTIANGRALTTVWSGRPNWHFYHMGLGNSIGFSTLISQNNPNSCYVGNTTYSFFGKFASMSLLGDPALRMEYAEPVTTISSNISNGVVTINWDNVQMSDGYNIYRRYDNSPLFERLNTALISTNQFIDTTLTQPGIVHYYVKNVEVMNQVTGTYEKESIGNRTTVLSNLGLDIAMVDDVKVYPNPVDNQLIISAKTLESIEIYTMDGKAMGFRNELTGSQIAFDMTDFPLGTYLVVIETKERNRIFKKVVKK